MDNTRKEELLKEVPFEIRNVVKPLNNEDAWLIVIALLKKDEMTIMELTELIGDRTHAEDICKSLMAAGLIERYSHYFRDIGDDDRTFYRHTYISERLMKGLYNALLIMEQR